LNLSDGRLRAHEEIMQTSIQSPNERCAQGSGRKKMGKKKISKDRQQQTEEIIAFPKRGFAEGHFRRGKLSSFVRLGGRRDHLWERRT